MTDRLLAAVAPVLAVVAVFLSAAAAFAAPDPVLQNYRKRFSRDAYLSDKEAVVQELVAAGGIPARDALLWCAQRTKEYLESEQKDSDKAHAALAPIQAEFDELFRKYLAEETKRGNPNPKTHPAWPVTEKLAAARAALWDAEKKVQTCRSILGTVLRAQGAVLDSLAPADEAQVREKLGKDLAAAKDWSVRAELYESLGAAKIAWALRVLQDAAVKDADPRALVAALDGLGGREPQHVLPILVERLQDERWIVRAAALAALERTPSKETIDAVLARFPKEEGRLRDDCVRVLARLTGGKDVTPTPEAWKQWWALNREAWAGVPKDVPIDPFRASEDLPKDAAKRTGFFGLEVKSRRLCFVIDVSGSMNEPASKSGKATRAERAKEELTTVLRALEDGAWFAVVLYSSDVRAWKGEMTLSSAETRKSAIEFVQAAQVVGGTNTYDALEFAFRLGDVGKGKARGADGSGDAKLDTIVFLSDGKPSLGRVTDPDGIRTAVRDWHKARRIAVHTISFGGDADVKFMEGLAQDTGGTLLVR
jgi:hypothetical protein